MDYRNILYSAEAGIARLTLSRPDKLNSFTGEMHAELRDALDRIQADSSVRVLVLTGAGRAFCAGQDLADPEMSAMPDGRLADIGNVVENNYKPLILRLQNLRVPTIAAVNGIAAGAGASVALACDLVVATKSASFLQAFSKVGLIPDTGGTWFLPQRVDMALLQHEDARKPQFGPWNAARTEDLVMQRFGFVELADADVQLRLQPHQIGQVLGVLVAGDAAVFDRTDRVAEAHQLPGGQEDIALLEGAQQAHAQRLGIERLEDVVVRRQFAGAGDALVVAFGGDHDEHRVGREDAVGVEVLQQVL